MTVAYKKHPHNNWDDYGTTEKQQSAPDPWGHATEL